MELIPKSEEWVKVVLVNGAGAVLQKDKSWSLAANAYENAWLFRRKRRTVQMLMMDHSGTVKAIIMRKLGKKWIPTSSTFMRR